LGKSKNYKVLKFYNPLHIQKVKYVNKFSQINVYKNPQTAFLTVSKMEITYEQVEGFDIECHKPIKVEPDERLQVEFYGEPIPDDDENDDMLFELAAGIAVPKKTEVRIAEEPLPNDEIIVLDYCKFPKFHF
jgi:predicted transcriptional regulator